MWGVFQMGFKKGHKINQKLSLSERFWSKVSKKEENECWEWNGTKHISGYGILRVNGKNEYSHRIGYQIMIGTISKNLFVLHSCDNPSCCNPKHLWLGTYKDNSDDMIRKRRRRSDKGELNPQHKLTEKQVVEIRSLYSTGKYTQRELGKKYNVTQGQISRIIRNMEWVDYNGRHYKM